MDIADGEGRWDSVLEIRGRMSPPVCCCLEAELCLAGCLLQKQEVSRGEVSADMERDKMPCA